MIVFSQDRFESLLETVRNRIARIFPVSGNHNTISVGNLRWENVGADIYSDPDLHKKYKINGKTLASRLVGTVKITDKSGKVLDSAAKHPLLLVPHITSKQSFIVQGKEVQIVNQLRLKPGTYTRYTADNNVETFVNTAGGGYRIQLDRVSGVFQVRVGQSTYVYLYPILKGLGVGDDVLRKIWGDKVFTSNRAYDRPGEMLKLYKKLRPYVAAPQEPEELAGAVKSFFESKALDPAITKLTLGAPYARIEPQVLVASSERALNLAKGETKADDTENLAFKSLHAIDDFILEKVEQNADAAVRAMKFNIDRRPRVIDVLPPSLFTKPIISFFTTSEFSRYSDQNNPLDMIGVQSFVTVLGEGGISSTHAITDNLRALHPSHMYALDPVHIPECFDEKTEVMVEGGWVPWPEVTEETKFACLIDGKLAYARAYRLISEPWAGPMIYLSARGMDRAHGNEYFGVFALLTPNHRVILNVAPYPGWNPPPPELIMTAEDVARAHEIDRSRFRVLHGVPTILEKRWGRSSGAHVLDVKIARFSGMVYCAEVPGGCLYTRRAPLRPTYAGEKIHGFWSGNSTKIGITGHLALGAKKVGNDIAITVHNARTGKKELKKIFDLEDKVVAFHEQYDLTKTPPRPRTKSVKVRVDGELKMVPASRVDYIFDHPSKMFGFVGSAVPFVHTNSPNRVLMASHHIEQAVALSDPDVPRVQARAGSRGYESQVGKAIVPQAPVNGVVSRIVGNVITIRGDDKKNYDIKLHDHYPLNSNTFLNEHPIVQVGTRVIKGQSLADSDFTRNGELALGKTLRTAYIPYKGYNFEDGVVISEGAAKKMTSVHKHEIALDIDPAITVGLPRLLAHFPTYMSGLDRSKYGPDGLPRKGAVITFDELVVPAVRRIKVHEEFDYSKLHKSLANQWMDVSKKWDNQYPGEVMDVVKTQRFVRVYLKTFEPMEVGDKVSQRHGGKGIVTLILPDKEMYRDSRGNVIDVLFNPAGVLGRANPGQLLEAAAARIAEKTGKPYLVSNFNDTHSLDTIRKDLKRHGMGDDVAESITDPTTNKIIDDVMVGDLHYVKLRHQVSKKLSARGTTSYTHDESPARQPQANPMSIGAMELYSLLSGGATAFLRDATTIKSNKNDDYWRAIQLGLPTPPPKTPFVVDKFVTYMKGAGINLTQDGTKLKALPMTDREILAQSNGEITSPGVVRANDLSPEPDGLFDRGLTGGFDGVYWNHISLAEPIPNPLMDQAIVYVLNTPTRPFTRTEFSDLLNGTLWVTPDGRMTTESKGNVTGGAAIRVLLSKINVKQEIQVINSQIPFLKGTRKDHAVRRLRYLSALNDMGLSPVEAYINQHVSVVPAKMRSIYPNPDGTLNVADPVHGYREVIMINNQIKDLKNLGVDAKNIAPLYSQLYAANRGLVGLQEPLTRGQNFKGFIATIKGQQNKYGLFQGKVVKRRQDLTGRSTIIPDPKLGIDEVKLPEEMAYVIYKPFIVQRLVEMGHSPLQARELTENKDSLARAALEIILKERPVILNRAPSLHKFSLLSFKPQITQGRAIEINPLVVKGFNADFDGDAMMVHVPVSEAARNEASTKLLPSNNLFSPRDNSIVHAPSMEMVLGVYLMTTPKGTPISAKSEQAVLSMYKAGKILVNQPVIVGGKTICPGQILFNEILPKGLGPGLVPVNKTTLMGLIARIAREKPAIAGHVITKIKDLGNHYVTEVGWSFSLRDLQFPLAVKNKIIADAAKKAKKDGFGPAFGNAFDNMQKAVAAHKDNRIVLGGLTSGAFGKSEQITQTIAAPVAVTDHQGKVTEIPITSPFAQGLDSASYWSIIPGSRKGLMDRALSTQDTGTFSKQLLAATVDTTITMNDCGTTEGITLAINDPDVLDRVVAKGAYRGKIAHPQMIRNMQARGIKTLVMRSPLKCQAVRGICALCFGPLENGNLPNIGYHVGALAGQTISEPATQMTMKNFHTSGAVGGSTIGYHRLKQILTMPTNVRGKAILAMKAGKVDAVEPAAVGGWNVTIGGTNHFVPQEMGINVVKGQGVRAGDLLSKGGLIRPQDVLAATNSIARVQDQMINDLSHEFTNANVRVRRKIFETAIQPFTNRAVVEEAGDAGKEFGIHVGDTLSVNNIQAMNKKLKAGKKKQITFTPVLLSLRAAPHYSEDFIGQLIAERPHETLKRAPALGYVSDIGPSGHPVATYAFGRYFGTKVNENVKKVAQDVVDDLDDMIESTVDVPAVEEDLSEMGRLMSDLRTLCESGPVHRLRD